MTPLQEEIAIDMLGRGYGVEDIFAGYRIPEAETRKLIADLRRSGLLRELVSPEEPILKPREDDANQV